jgi:hypothetical protein
MNKNSNENSKPLIKLSNNLLLGYHFTVKGSSVLIHALLIDYIKNHSSKIVCKTKDESNGSMIFLLENATPDEYQKSVDYINDKV